ncbi:MAG: sigma-70 family RNA polymerase sigma factor, partial [Planctomycetes bacterium]|nr:sigma-70 family RNA polymerase sigma factor [Planctomycetota bacterium]
MFVRTVDRAFVRFQRTGAAAALALVFDRTAPELLRLARHLAVRGVAAEDLLQQTFVTAIESRRSYDPAQQVLPWLVGILNNHARAARRRQNRALDPNRLQRDDTVHAAEVAEHAELAHELERAIGRLPEPSRPVVRLHLQHGLEPREIARSLERPDGTVRAQLHRGLVSLRRLLPTGVGAGVGAQAAGHGLAAVRGFVLQRCGGLAGGARGAVTTWGVAFMLFNKKVWAAAVVAVVCIGIGVLGVGEGVSPPPPSAEVAAVPAVGGLAEPTTTASPLARYDAAPAAPPAETSPRAGAAMASVQVSLVDGDGAPVVGLVVACRVVGGAQVGPAPVLQATDAGGITVFEVEPKVSHAIETDAGFQLGRVRVAAATTQMQVTYVLRGGHVIGSVRDADGRPVPGAAVFAHGIQVEGRQVATAGDEGQFELRFAQQWLRLQARAPGRRCSPPRSVQVEPGGQEQIELRLGGRAAVLTGRVLTPDGQPAADALVSCLPFVPDAPVGASPDECPVQARTAIDGTFRIDEAPMGEVIVTAAGRDQRHAPAGSRTTALAHETFVELRLRPAVVIEGRFTEAGRALDDVLVHAQVLPSADPASVLNHDLGSATMNTGADGRFRLGGLPAGSVQVSATRDRGTQIAAASWQLEPGETKVWEHDVAGHELHVRVEPASPPSGGRWTVAVQREGTKVTSMQPTDERGVARFLDQQPGRYTFYVQLGDGGPTLVSMARGGADVPGPDAVLRVPPERLLRHELRGRVVDAVGAAAPGLSLCVREVGDGTFVSIARPTTGPEGFFVVDGLPSGTFEIFAVGPAGMQRLAEARLAGGIAADVGVLVQ